MRRAWESVLTVRKAEQEARVWACLPVLLSVCNQTSQSRTMASRVVAAGGAGPGQELGVRWCHCQAAYR